MGGAELRQQVICEHEPLWLVEVAASPCRAKPATPAVKFPCLSPTTLSKDGTLGKIVHNTFIHQVAPPTPEAGARSRASALPKDWGSDKSTYEAACHALSYLHKAVDSDGSATTCEVAQEVAECSLASWCRKDSPLESQERQRWRPAPGRSSWPRDVDSRADFLSGAFDPLKVWLSGSSAGQTPDQPYLSMVSAGTGSAICTSPATAFGGHRHRSLTTETHLAPFQGSGSRSGSLTGTGGSGVGFSNFDLLSFDEVSLNPGFGSLLDAGAFSVVQICGRQLADAVLSWHRTASRRSSHSVPLEPCRWSPTTGLARLRRQTRVSGAHSG